MGGPDRAEMALVERGEPRGAESLHEGQDGRINDTEGKVEVGGLELAAARKVAGRHDPHLSGSRDASVGDTCALGARRCRP